MSDCSEVQNVIMLFEGFRPAPVDSSKEFKTFGDVDHTDWVAIVIDEYETGEHTITIFLKKAGMNNALLSEYKSESKYWESDFKKVRFLLTGSHCRPEFDRRHLHCTRLEVPGTYVFRRDQRFSKKLGDRA